MRACDAIEQPVAVHLTAGHVDRPWIDQNCILAHSELIACNEAGYIADERAANVHPEDVAARVPRIVGAGIVAVQRVDARRFDWGRVLDGAAHVELRVLERALGARP